jgi:hypothetical protein
LPASPSGPATLAEFAGALADGIDAALPGWVSRSVERAMRAWAGAVPPSVVSAATEAGQRARAGVMPTLRALLAADIDEQWTTPLAVLRGAVRYPAGVLAAAGVPPAERDSFALAAFPDDDYDLCPASFADIDPSLAEVGLAWGAAKAFEHKRRHRS